jgi:hypothetical protein
MKSTPIESIEKQLLSARHELATVQEKFSEFVAREKTLTDHRSPLLRDAIVRGNAKAQASLNEIDAEIAMVRQQAADFQQLTMEITGDITALERRYENAQKEVRYNQLRAFMADRGRIAERVEESLDALVKQISTYINSADELLAAARDLSLPNVSARSMRGTPLLRDCIQNRLRFLLPELPQPQQRNRLSRMEVEAQEFLETLITSSQGAAMIS